MNVSIEQIRPELTWHLRQKVLYPVQKLYEMEMDEDQNGIHFGGFADNKLIAVVSLFDLKGDFQFRKLAVDFDYQGKGIGNELLTYITDFAKAEGATGSGVMRGLPLLVSMPKMASGIMVNPSQGTASTTRSGKSFYKENAGLMRQAGNQSTNLILKKLLAAK